MWIDFPRYEFEGVGGEVHAFCGCSLAGKFEFDDLLRRIQAALQQAGDEASPELFYQEHQAFRALIHRALEVNGIDPDWVTWPMVESLLFFRDGEGGLREAWLIEVNRLRDRPKRATPAPEASLADVIAGLSHISGSLKDAVEAANNLQPDLAIDILEARAEQSKPSKGGKGPVADAFERAEFKAWANQQRSNTSGHKP